jgi:hypothetical protein
MSNWFRFLRKISRNKRQSRKQQNTTILPRGGNERSPGASFGGADHPKA